MQHRLAGERSRQEQIDERCRDAVVEPTLHVDEATDAGRHALVTHDGRPEGSVGRRHDRTDECGHPEPVAAEQERSDGGSGGDRERQPDAQQPQRLGGGRP